MEISQMLDALEEASELEGTEMGEWWSLLISIQYRIYDFGSEEFIKAYEDQVREAYQDFQDNWEVVFEEYIPPTPQIIKVLKYKHE